MKQQKEMKRTRRENSDAALDSWSCRWPMTMSNLVNKIKLMRTLPKYTNNIVVLIMVQIQQKCQFLFDHES